MTDSNSRSKINYNFGGSFLKYNIELIFSNFKISGKFIEGQVYGNGHINDTYLIVVKNGNLKEKYILQRINHFVFKNPAMLMDNVKRVTDHIIKKIILAGGDPSQQTLNIQLTNNNNPFYIDTDGNYWRVFQFIHDAIGYDIIDNPEIAYQGGRAFGQFQSWLVDLPGEPLFETIPNFNNPTHLLKKFDEILKADVKKRASSVSDQIKFIKSKADEMQKLVRMGENGELPFRITHNDTKINNVLIDMHTNKAVCVIDLDTVMTGFSLNDFGDSIRTATNTGAEDDIDLSKVGIDLELFEAYTKGYLEYAKEFLTQNELDNLAFSGKLYPYIIGLRFLSDYLDGDNYFKIEHSEHNLQRAKAQFKLMSDMEINFDKMKDIVNKIYNSLQDK